MPKLAEPNLGVISGRLGGERPGKVICHGNALPVPRSRPDPEAHAGPTGGKRSSHAVLRGLDEDSIVREHSVQTNTLERWSPQYAMSTRKRK
ncbi:hypothetical protein VTN96DRAFT_1645 [Rasamsonia emersonii]